ncbi:MAG: Gfo/Idh/MocA family oxidoreductase [Candidatus Hydrogenedentes bacterium]|nr:Gfo/Idh/MocA family oxidoreductase [Candidatus Hydrogenedentota bacterium]
MPQELHHPTTHELTRRHFLQHTTTAAVAGAILASPRRAAANDRLGIAVIGCGSRGGSHLSMWDRMAQEEKNVEIVAVCDVYRPRLARAAERYKVPASYMDHRELLADPAVDIVSIATPDHLHGYQAIDAVNAGKDVYCEKPVTHWRQFELTKQLAAAVKASGRAFQLGTQGMSDAAWHQMKKLVQEGLIGQPIHAECGYFRVGDWGERGMPIDDPNAVAGPDLNWEAFLGDSPKRDFDVSRFFRWRMYEDYAGGPCTDLFPHCLTPVTSILGAGMPSSAVGTGGKFRYQEREVPDTFNMLVDYPSGLTIAVLGTQGNDDQGTVSRGAGGRLPLVRGWDGSLTLEGEEIVFRPAQGSEKQAARFAIEHGEDTYLHFRNLVQCRAEGRVDTWSDAQLAYETQTALIMGYLALREGKTARFDAARETISL